MSTYINDIYLFKALDNYPYNIPESIESLNYALSYDPENPLALALLGQIYSEQLFKYDEAIDIFERALANDVYAISVYEPYIQLLIKLEQFEKALQLIKFALSIKGIDKGNILYLQCQVLEVKREYKHIKNVMKEAKLYSYSQHNIDLLNEMKTRIKLKLKLLHVKKSK